MSMISMNADLILDSEINETTARLLNNIIRYDEIGQEKHKAVCDELEQAHKEIEALKKAIWHYEYNLSSNLGATNERAKLWADKFVANIEAGE